MNLTKDTRQARHEARRDLILQTACECFRKQGMRSTSIAEISKLTQLGAGQIYRCFTNKEEMVEEIVMRILEQRIKHIVTVNNDFDIKATMLASDVPIVMDESDEDEALLLEINAEAARNPRIAEILIKADDQLMQQGYIVIKSNYPWLDDNRISAINELMAVLMEGTLLRRRIRKNRNVENKKILKDLFVHILKSAYQEHFNL